MRPHKSLSLGVAATLIFLATGCARQPSDGKIHVIYWEQWSGAEEYAMQRVVDEYNQSQDKIEVDYLSVGLCYQKTLLATAGGDPPDVAGVDLRDIASMADRSALTPLDDYIRADGSTPDQYLSRYAKAYAGLGFYDGAVYALPSTPTTTALYWNKDLFRAAGLDPEKPPRTVAELAAMSVKLTVRDHEGNLKQVGFLPQISASWMWGGYQWFGGSIFDGKNITIGTDPNNIKMLNWVASYTKINGVKSIERLAANFGELASPQDPFDSGQVAMDLDGVWRSHFIHQFAPGMDYGVTGWPAAQPGINDFSTVDSNMLIIPRGAKHAREAWEFMNYVSSPNLSAQSMDELRGIELVCFIQEKASPLVQWSPYFTTHNPNRDVDVFRKLADSPHVVIPPSMGIWDEYRRDCDTAFDQVKLGIETPENALRNCQALVQQSWEWHSQSMALRNKQIATSPSPNLPSSP